MSELDDTTEVFKQAVTSTMRAISGNDELTVSFGRGKPYIQGNKARIPLPQGGMTEAELATLRGTSDKFALQERYHDDAKHRENRPETGLAQQVFDSVEDARIAGIGSYLMKGVEDNLTAQLESHCEEQNYLEIETQAQAPLGEAVGLFVRESLGLPIPPTASHVLELWRNHIEAAVGDHLKQADERILIRKISQS